MLASLIASILALTTALSVIIQPEIPDCSDPSNNGKFFANPKDCSKFDRCVNGQVITQPCAPGTLFNPEINACDWPRNVDCDTTTTTTTTAAPECLTENDMANFAEDATNCKRYNLCVNGMLFNLRCGPGKLFQNGCCRKASRVDCGDRPNL